VLARRSTSRQVSMAFLQEIVVLGLLVLCMTAAVSSHSRHSRYTPPNVKRLTDAFTHVSIGQEYSTFFGGSNTKLLNNGSSANLALDKSSGSYAARSLVPW
jgi:xyloglucan:xyloglucosyl transferase